MDLSRGLGDVYKRQDRHLPTSTLFLGWKVRWSIKQ
jgi:hypothetical protein